MKEFFKRELETLQVRTGIRQLENLMQKENWKQEVEQLIKFMIDECNKPPFDVVRPEVKERVIARAIVEDGDFIGLNAKFVRRALNAWWLAHGDRVIEAMNQKEAKVYEKVELTEEQKQKIDVMANAYVARLLNGDGPASVPKLDNDSVKREGGERVGEIERKSVAVKYKPMSEEDYILKERIRRAGTELYRGRFDLHLRIFRVNGHDIFAESSSDAEKIYALASEAK